MMMMMMMMLMMMMMIMMVMIIIRGLYAHSPPRGRPTGQLRPQGPGGSNRSGYAGEDFWGGGVWLLGRVPKASPKVHFFLVVPLPPFVSLGSAVAPGQSPAVTSLEGLGSVGVCLTVFVFVGPTMSSASGVELPGAVLLGAEGCGGVVFDGQNRLPRKRKVARGTVPSQSRHLKQAVARAVSSGARRNRLRRIVRSLMKMPAH